MTNDSKQSLHKVFKDNPARIIVITGEGFKIFARPTTGCANPHAAIEARKNPPVEVATPLIFQDAVQVVHRYHDDIVWEIDKENTKAKKFSEGWMEYLEAEANKE